MSKAIAERLQDIRQKAELFVAQRTKYDEADKEGDKIHAAYMDKVLIAKTLRQQRDLAANEHWKTLRAEEAECAEQLRETALQEHKQHAASMPPATAPTKQVPPVRSGSARRGVGSGDKAPAAESSDDDD